MFHTGMRLPCFCGPTTGPLPGLIRLHGSVGQGGHNRSSDVQALQAALNTVPADAGGPAVPLAVDGLVGPKTIGAIRAVQTMWTRVQDGRADPAGPTLKVVNRLAGATLPPGTRMVGGFAPTGAPAPPSPAPPATPPNVAAAMARLMLVQRVIMPQVVAAAIAAATVLTASQRHIAGVQGRPPPTGAALRSPERLAFLFAAKHFRLHESDAFGSLMALQRATANVATLLSIVQSRTVTVGGAPWFDRLYALPSPALRPGITTNIAYVGLVGGGLRPGQADGYDVPRPDGQGAMPELCDGVYLLPGFDMFPAQHAPMLFHELMHLTGGGGTGFIVDMPDTFAGEASYAAQPRNQRLQNVSTYEYFATEVSRGSAAAMLTYQMSGAPHPTDWARTPPFLDGAGAGFLAPVTPGAPDPIAFPAGMA